MKDLINRLVRISFSRKDKKNTNKVRKSYTINPLTAKKIKVICAQFHNLSAGDLIEIMFEHFEPIINEQLGQFHNGNFVLNGFEEAPVNKLASTKHIHVPDGLYDDDGQDYDNYTPEEFEIID